MKKYILNIMVLCMISVLHAADMPQAPSTPTSHVSNSCPELKKRKRQDNGVDHELRQEKLEKMKRNLTKVFDLQALEDQEGDFAALNLGESSQSSASGKNHPMVSDSEDEVTDF